MELFSRGVSRDPAGDEKRAHRQHAGDHFRHRADRGLHHRGGDFLACWWSEKGQEAPYIYRQIEIKSTKRIRLAFKIEHESKDGYEQCPIANLQNIIRRKYNKYKNGNRSGKSSSFSYFDINLKKGDITLEAFKEHLKPFKEFEMDDLYKAVKETN